MKKVWNVRFWISELSWFFPFSFPFRTSCLLSFGSIWEIWKNPGDESSAANNKLKCVECESESKKTGMCRRRWWWNEWILSIRRQRSKCTEFSILATAAAQIIIYFFILLLKRDAIIERIFWIFTLTRQRTSYQFRPHMHERGSFSLNPCNSEFSC